MGNGENAASADPVAISEAARAALERGELEAAERGYRSILAWPEHRAFAMEGLARVKIEQGALDEALALAQSCAALRPTHAEGLLNCAILAAQSGHVDIAVAWRDRAVTCGAGRAFATRHVSRAYSAYLCGLSYRHDLPRAALVAAHHRWYDAIYRDAVDRVPAGRRRRTSGGPLRVGFVSADFYAHPVGVLLLPLLEHRDRTATRFVAYCNNEIHDGATERMRGLFDQWRDITALDDPAVAQQVADDGIDILVDLSGHTKGNRLGVFVHRPAPVQMSFLGYWETTGLPTMDYAPFDYCSVAFDEEGAFRERILRFPHSRFLFRRPEYAPPPGHWEKHPWQKEIVFCSYNSVWKVGPPVLETWSRILRALPEARLEIRCKHLANAPMLERFRASIAAAGIDPARVNLGAGISHQRLLDSYLGVVAALDAFPFSGGLTSLDALSMGTPVVTLRGDRPVGRQTESFLRIAGAPELVVPDPDAYVALAVRLAREPALRARLRATIAAGMERHERTAVESYTRDFEGMLHAVWAHHFHTRGRGDETLPSA